jgi:hypothetical protein
VLRRFRHDDRETIARWNADADFTRHLAGVQTREQSDAGFDRWQRPGTSTGSACRQSSGARGELIGRAGRSTTAVAHDRAGWASPGLWGRGSRPEAGARW